MKNLEEKHVFCMFPFKMQVKSYKHAKNMHFSMFFTLFQPERWTSQKWSWAPGLTCILNMQKICMLLFPTERWNRIPNPKSNSQPPRWLMPARWYLTLREHASGTCILNVHIQRHAFWPCILHMLFLDPAFWTYKFQVSTCILGGMGLWLERKS